MTLAAAATFTKPDIDYARLSQRADAQRHLVEQQRVAAAKDALDGKSPDRA